MSLLCHRRVIRVQHYFLKGIIDPRGGGGKAAGKKNGCYLLRLKRTAFAALSVIRV